ncbi:TetR/AcrR family transcriptional regulator [Nocardioides daphniae]|uniref:HTH tetR-type domain-containing protein n=1 Tax=Nocardioides daphniae TaxID=402297 RepID=A0ABQ1QMA6_9ACTN|nr:TetR/AcrR family transcriptional regulator [Nocardioides daphniae]GGD31146.1 hypothetical protein GCM10007231_33380 [Nocardioides daphniae]
MRADAARRRARIVEEARRLFAAQGGNVALEAVAEASGVGIATLYRNFESRAALSDAVVLTILGDLRVAADEAVGELQGAGGEAGAAWERFVRRLVALDLGALTAAFAEHAAQHLSDEVRETQASTLSGVEEVLAAGREAHCVRGDVKALELVVLVGTLTRPQPAAVLEAAPELPQRLVDVVLDGLRPRS